MKYIDADKLIAKIKELNLVTKTYEEQVAFNNALAMVVEIIDSLQQEQPEVDLEKEIDKWFDSMGEAWEDGEWSTNDIKSTARHFFELGLNARKEKQDEAICKNRPKSAV